MNKPNMPILVPLLLAALLAGPALAHDRPYRDGYDRYRGQHDGYRYDHRRYDHRRHHRHYDYRRHHIPPPYYRGHYGYRVGYGFGWHDARPFYGHGYRPGYWYRDPYDSHWYFSFYFEG